LDEVTVIKPSPRRQLLRIGEIWRYRGLLYFLLWRDIKVRYKQTFFGASWALLQPLVLMSLFALVFGRFARLPSEGIPYPLFALAALVPWTFFAQSLGSASESLVGNSNLITKIYFPRLLIPLAAAGSYLLDYAISLLLLTAVVVWYGDFPGIRLLWLPPLTILVSLTSIAVGIWLSALNVKYRDVRYAIPFVIQIWLFATPVAYGSNILPERWEGLFALNPMKAVVDSFRWVLLETETPGPDIYISLVVVLVTFVAGLSYFNRTQRTFADVI
jgi:lipopolysaccharide transport system permease protein